MQKPERKQEILRILKQQGYTTVEQLCKLIYASASSVRRDLNELAERGLIQRSHGGAELAANNTALIPYTVRRSSNTEAKRKIAEKVAGIIREGDVVFLDQSSSSFYVAASLIHKKDITIVTNNVEIISGLNQYSIRILCCGGILCSNNRYALVGKDAESFISQIHADYAIFSCRSLTEGGELYDCQYDEMAVRSAMVSHAEKSLFLCTSDKIDTVSAYRFCSLAEIDFLVCEDGQGEKYAEAFPNLTIL